MTRPHAARTTASGRRWAGNDGPAWLSNGVFCPVQKYHTRAKFLSRACHTLSSASIWVCITFEMQAAWGAMMFDIASKAIDYQWQALKHEEQALRARNATIKEGFSALAEMCQARAAQMERQAQLMKARRSV
jgi:hypothetical protein